MKATQLTLRTYVLTLSKVFSTLKFIQILVKRLCLYIGQGCVCLRTACAFAEVDKENITLPSKNHSNFCICSFVRIVGCDFYIWHRWYPTSWSSLTIQYKQGGGHHWWDTLFAWSPTANGILHTLCHPIIVILILVGISPVLSVIILIWNWRMLYRIAMLTSLLHVHGMALSDQYQAGNLCCE